MGELHHWQVHARTFAVLTGSLHGKRRQNHKMFSSRLKYRCADRVWVPILLDHAVKAMCCSGLFLLMPVRVRIEFAVYVCVRSHNFQELTVSHFRKAQWHMRSESSGQMPVFVVLVAFASSCSVPGAFCSSCLVLAVVV